ncbi:unnamed protein product [Lathyrus oleraceus]
MGLGALEAQSGMQIVEGESISILFSHCYKLGHALWLDELKRRVGMILILNKVLANCGSRLTWSHVNHEDLW